MLASVRRILLTAGALAGVARADVLTVGPAGSGAQFQQIQAAIDAAQDDDVILVQPGTYARVVIEQPLRILGVAPGVVIDAGSDQTAVIVRGIAAGRELVLSGLRARTVGFFTRPTSIQLEDSPGTLVLQDIVVENDPFVGATVGLSCTACARVLLLESRILHAGELSRQTGAVVAEASELWVVGCLIRGADDPYFAYSGAHGLQASDSTLRLWRSELVGGGAEGKNGVGNGQGGAALHATRSEVQLFGGPGARLAGGNGEEMIFGEGLGAPGLELLDHSSARVQQDIPITGGLDGFDLTQAPPLRADGTSAFTLEAKVFPTLASNLPRAALGSSFELTLAGQPGAFQVLYLALETGPTALFRWVDGAGLLDQAHLFQLASAILPPAGRQVVPIHVPSSLALLGATLFFQSAERFPNGFLRGGTGTPRRFAIGNPVLVPVTN